MEQSSKMLFKYATDDFSWILGVIHPLSLLLHHVKLYGLAQRF